MECIYFHSLTSHFHWYGFCFNQDYSSSVISHSNLYPLCLRRQYVTDFTNTHTHRCALSEGETEIRVFVLWESRCCEVRKHFPLPLFSNWGLWTLRFSIGDKRLAVEETFAIELSSHCRTICSFVKEKTYLFPPISIGSFTTAVHPANLGEKANMNKTPDR